MMNLPDTNEVLKNYNIKRNNIYVVLTICQVLFKARFDISSVNPYSNYKVMTVIISFLWVRKLRYKEVK